MSATGFAKLPTPRLGGSRATVCSVGVAVAPRSGACHFWGGGVGSTGLKTLAPPHLAPPCASSSTGANNTQPPAAVSGNAPGDNCLGTKDLAQAVKWFAVAFFCAFLLLSVAIVFGCMMLAGKADPVVSYISDLIAGVKHSALHFGMPASVSVATPILCTPKGWIAASAGTASFGLQWLIRHWPVPGRW